MSGKDTGQSSADKYARWALMLGLMSFCCTCMTGVPAIILGLVARGKATKGAKIEANLGLALGFLGCILGTVAIIHGQLEDRQVDRLHQEEIAVAKAQQAAELQALLDEAPGVFERCHEALSAADSHMEKEDWANVRTELENAQKMLKPYAEKRQTELDGYEELVSELQTRSEIAKAWKSYDDAQYDIKAQRYLAADEALRLVGADLDGIPEELRKRGGISTLQKKIQADRKRIAGKANAEREKKAEAEALARVCGPEPTLSAWDGGLGAAESYVKRSAHDPSSIDVENCSTPVLTKACWKTTCAVRGKNAFGALVLNSHTFYVGVDPDYPSLPMVLAME